MTKLVTPDMTSFVNIASAVPTSQMWRETNTVEQIHRKASRRASVASKRAGLY